MSSLPNTVQSREVQALESVRPRQAKAGLGKSSAVEVVQDGLLPRLSSIVESALLTAHGSKKAAAIEVGCDQSQLNRQVSIGTFDERQMAAAGAVFLAALGKALVEEFGAAQKSKRQIALEQLPTLIQLTLDALTDSKE